MIDTHSRHVNMHKNGIFYSLFCINDHIILCIYCMLSITVNPSNFISYVPCSSNRKVQTTYGSLLIVAGIGEIKLDPIGICISQVIVQKLAKILKITIYFDEDYSFLINNLSK